MTSSGSICFTACSASSTSIVQVFCPRPPIGIISTVGRSPSQSFRSNESPRFRSVLSPIEMLNPIAPRPVRSPGPGVFRILKPSNDTSIGPCTARTVSILTSSSVMESPTSSGCRFSMGTQDVSSLPRGSMTSVWPFSDFVKPTPHTTGAPDASATRSDCQ